MAWQAKAQAQRQDQTDSNVHTRLGGNGPEGAAGHLTLPLFLKFPPKTKVPVDQRETNQEQRIQRGVQSGRLTPQEATKLEGQEANIRAREAKYKADGKISRREHHKLERKLDRASRDIGKAEHNSSHR